jgi:two-component system OmpR family response regulator
MSGKLKVLLAEDDPSLSRYFQSLLRQWGCEIAVVQTGEAAVRRAAGFKPDIALLGFVTPGMDGAKAGVSLLQVSPRTKVVLTVEPVPGEILAGLRVQGHDFWTLLAPFGSEELRALCFPPSSHIAE